MINLQKRETTQPMHIHRQWGRVNFFWVGSNIFLPLLEGVQFFLRPAHGYLLHPVTLYLMNSPYRQVTSLLALIKVTTYILMDITIS